MSTLKVDKIEPLTGTNTSLVLRGKGDKSVDLPADFTVEGNPNSLGSPIGVIDTFSTNIPTSYLEIKDTRQGFLKTAYPDLDTQLAAKGYPWGSDATTFNIPNKEDIGKGAKTYTKTWQSAQTLVDTVTSGEFSHDLGAVPDNVQVEAICTSTDGQFAVGDRLIIPATYNGYGDNRVILVRADDSQIRYTVATGCSGYWFYTIHPTTGVGHGLTEGKWDFVIKASLTVDQSFDPNLSYGIKAFNTAELPANLDLETLASYSRIPVGFILPGGGSDDEPGFRKLLDQDVGESVSRTTYSALFAKIGTRYGEGDGSTTFNLPSAKDALLASSAMTLVAPGFLKGFATGNWAAGAWSFGSDGHIQTTSGYHIMAYHQEAVLKGDFTFSYTHDTVNNSSSGSGSNATYQFGVSLSTSVNQSQDLYQNANDNFLYATYGGVASNTIISVFVGQTLKVSLPARPVAAGDKFEWRRVGDTFSLYQNGVLLHTETGYKTTADVHPIFGHGIWNVRIHYHNAQWTTDDNVNVIPSTFYIKTHDVITEAAGVATADLVAEVNAAKALVEERTVQRGSVVLAATNKDVVEFDIPANATAITVDWVNIAFAATAGLGARLCHGDNIESGGHATSVNYSTSAPRHTDGFWLQHSNTVATSQLYTGRLELKRFTGDVWTGVSQSYNTSHTYSGCHGGGVCAMEAELTSLKFGTLSGVLMTQGSIKVSWEI